MDIITLAMTLTDMLNGTRDWFLGYLFVTDTLRYMAPERQILVSTTNKNYVGFFERWMSFYVSCIPLFLLFSFFPIHFPSTRTILPLSVLLQTPPVYVFLGSILFLME
jgi:hypothetical protein